MAQSDVQEIDLFSSLTADFANAGFVLPSSLFPDDDLAALPPINKPAKSSAKAHDAKAHDPKAHDAFKTISETADLLALPAHVLRFWESNFGQLKPLKLRGGRRYYRPQDIDTLVTIKQLLYKQGYTIKGARKAMTDSRKQKNRDMREMTKDQKSRAPSDMLDTPLFGALMATPGPEIHIPITPAPAAPALSAERKEALRAIHAELMDLKKLLLALPVA